MKDDLVNPDHAEATNTLSETTKNSSGFMSSFGQPSSWADDKENPDNPS